MSAKQDLKTALTSADAQQMDTKKAFGKQGLWDPVPIPISESVWRRLNFRGRLRIWLELADNGNPFPIGAAVVYAVKFPIWFSVFNYVFRDRQLPFSSELNVKRWIVYNLLHDVLGFGATSGQIGFKEVGPALALLGALAPFDVMPFFASRGEHYVYQMICCAFSGPQWKFGCQMVQLALWIGAG